MIISIFTLLCGLGLAISGSLTFWPVQHWYDFYIPIVLLIAGLVAGLLLSIIWYFFIGLFVSKKKEYKKPNKFFEFFFLQLVKFGTFHSRAKVKIIGKEKLPKKGTFVIVCNHRSNFDPIIISAKFGNRHIAFISKEANFKIPLVSPLIRACCYLPIIRTDLLKSLETMKKATSLVASGVTSIGVFPEGTRQQKEIIGDFHEGCFNIAIKGEVPLVVTTVKETDNIHKNFPWKRTKITLEIVEVYEHDEIANTPAKVLSDNVRNMMIESLSK